MEKKRLTITGNNIPDDIYKKLDDLGNQRKLTPYVVRLIEKEVEMNALIKGLSDLTSKVEGMERMLKEINNKLEIESVQSISDVSVLVSGGKIEVIIDKIKEESDF